MAKSFDREKLFAEVWTTPMVHLSKQYGMTSQSLRKQCESLGIPLPQNGHWTRLAAGQQIPRPPLPPAPPVTQEQAPKRRRKTVTLPGEPTDAVTLSTEPAVSPLVVASLHPAIRTLAGAYEEAAKQAFQMKAAHDWEVAHPGRAYRGPQLMFGNWQSFCAAGQLLMVRHKKSVLRVSLSSYQRAFRVLHDLSIRAEAVGYSASIAKDSSRLQLQRDKATVSIRIAERLAVSYRKDAPTWDRKLYSPTGQLSIHMESEGGGESVIVDKAGAILETQWDRIMSMAEQRHAQSLAQQAEWARYRKESEERERLRVEERRREAEERRLAEVERAKRESLITEARQWQTAELIRAYLANIDSKISADGILVDGFAAWKQWAMNVADDLDNTDERLKAFGRTE